MRVLDGSSGSASQRMEPAGAGEGGACQSECRFQQAAGRSAARGRRGGWGVQELPCSCVVPCASLLGTGVAIGGPAGTHCREGRGLGDCTAVRAGPAADQGPSTAWGWQGGMRGSEEPRSGGSAALPALQPCCIVRALHAVSSSSDPSEAIFGPTLAQGRPRSRLAAAVHHGGPARLPRCHSGAKPLPCRLDRVRRCVAALPAAAARLAQPAAP